MDKNFEKKLTEKEKRLIEINTEITNLKKVGDAISAGKIAKLEEERVGLISGTDNKKEGQSNPEYEEKVKDIEKRREEELNTNWSLQNEIIEDAFRGNKDKFKRKGEKYEYEYPKEITYNNTVFELGYTLSGHFTIKNTKTGFETKGTHVFIYNITDESAKLVQPRRKSVAQMTNEINAEYDTELVELKKSVDTNSTKTENKESLKHLYADAINNGEFFGTSDKPGDLSIYELNIEEGTFTIRPDAEKRVVGRPGNLEGCDVDAVQDGKILIIKEVGKMHESNGKFIIDSKLKVKIDNIKTNENVVSSEENNSVETSQTEVENKEWTEEDEKTLNDLLNTIEEAKKELAELDRLEAELNLKEEIENDLTKENNLETIGYLKTIQDGVFHTLSKTPENCFFRMFNQNGNTAEFEFSGDVQSTIANIDSTKEVCMSSGSSIGAKDIQNIEKGTVEKQTDGTWKIIKKPKIKFISQEEENSETEKEVTVEKKEVKTYDIEFIKGKIRELLSKVSAVEEIKKLEVKGSGGNIEINTTIKAKKFFISVDVNLNAVLENKDNKIVVKNYNLDAGKLTSVVDPMISSQLDKVTDLLKEYIEKEEKIKVEKIWIEDGELKAI